MENNSEDELSRALEIIQRHSAPARGDSFDIGNNANTPVTRRQDSDIIAEIIANPEKLTGLLQLTPKQVKNLRSLLVAAGAGGAHRLLSQYFGDELSAAFGGFASAWLAKRIVKG